MKTFDALVYLIVGGKIDGEPQKARCKINGDRLTFGRRAITFNATRSGLAHVAVYTNTHGIVFGSEPIAVISGSTVNLK